MCYSCFLYECNENVRMEGKEEAQHHWFADYLEEMPSSYDGSLDMNNSYMELASGFGETEVVHYI